MNKKDEKPELILQEAHIVVEPLQLEGSGFPKKYREVVQLKQAFMDPMKATVEDVDAAMAFLIGRVIEPKDKRQVQEILWNVDPDELLSLFEAITREATAVPPASGGASAASSD